MDKIILVEVTQDDIDTGYPGSVTSCPIAKAITRLYPTADYAVVSHESASVYIPETYWLRIFRKAKAKIIRINLPKRVATFITNFDVYGPKDAHVKPFTFEATAVERIQ